MGTGVGEAMLISAAVGAGTGAAGSAISGGDPLKGALTGAALGAVTGGVGAGFGGAANVAGGASEAALNAQIASEAASGVNAAVGAPAIAPEVANAAIQSNLTNSGNLQSGLDLGTNYGAVSGQVPGAQTVGINTLPTSTTPTYEYGGIKGNLVGSTNAPIISNAASPTPKGMFDFGYKGPTPNVFEYGPQSNLALGGIGATSGISAAMQAERDKYAVPAQEHYTGPLSRFKYDPSTYNPDVVRPPNPPYRAVYAAEGGIMSLAPNGYAMGGVPTRPPQTNFANPSSYEEGTSQYSMATDPMSGNIANRMAEGGEVSLENRIKNLGDYQKTNNGQQDFTNMIQILGGKSFKEPTNAYSLSPDYMASGGIASLGGYSDGGRLLKGPGDGMSDDIPARIGRKQEARLADGEFVVPADVVSHLGNGSTDAGAKTLYAMMNKVRKARTGNKKQGRQIQASSYLPA